MQLHPYLYFNGDCEAAFKFYEQCLKGQIQLMMTHADMPKDQWPSPEWREKILHARLTVGDGVLMASDAPPDHYKKPAGFSVSLQLNDIPEAERIFQALSNGGNVTMPIQQTFWAARFAMFTDKFGTPWMINCEQSA